MTLTLINGANKGLGYETARRLIGRALPGILVNAADLGFTSPAQPSQDAAG